MGQGALRLPFSLTDWRGPVIGHSTPKGAKGQVGRQAGGNILDSPRRRFHAGDGGSRLAAMPETGRADRVAGHARRSGFAGRPLANP